MLRKWVIETERASGANARAPAGFLSVAMTREPVAVEIRIEPQRGATAVKVAWPTSAAAECTAWLRELLK